MEPLRKSVRNLIQDEADIMRRLLSGYLDLLIRNSQDSTSWKERFSALAAKKIHSRYGSTYAEAKKALDRNPDAFSTADMDITLLTALLIDDMKSNSTGNLRPWLSTTNIQPRVSVWIRILRDDKNRYLSHETQTDDWKTWKRVLTCLSDMERFLDAVEDSIEKLRGDKSEFQKYVSFGRRLLQDEEEILQPIYDAARLPAVLNNELIEIADKVMASPNRPVAYLRAREPFHVNNSLVDQEKEQRLVFILAGMGLPDAQEDLGIIYGIGLLHNGRLMPPDYAASVELLSSCPLDSLSRDGLLALVRIIASPDTRPNNLGVERARELYNTCTDRAKAMNWIGASWPRWQP